MPILNLEKIFRPRSVAVIGASPTPGKVGQAVLKNLADAHFPGAIYPVNPRHQEIDGLACAPSIGSLPKVPDLAVVCTPAATVPGVLDECGAVGVPGIVILSAGFRELGPAGVQLEQQIQAKVAQHPGMRIVGPNCLGVIVPANGLNASFARGTPPAGRIAFLSQSGALCTAVLDWALQEQIGFSHFVSVGNTLDVNIGDLIDYLSQDELTDAIILYVESIGEAREFMSAARAFARGKPIVAYKAGRFAESAKAASSHTGAMAGVDAVYEAAFERAGIVRVFDVEDMFDCAELLARTKLPAGSRLAIVTNAGGPGVMATDTLMQLRGTLAALTPQSLEKLDAALPPSWSHGNPIDALGDATPDRLSYAVAVAQDDPQVDAVLVIMAPQALTDASECAKSVIEVARHGQKPILTSWMGGQTMKEANQLLNQAGLPTFSAPEKAVRAFMRLVSYHGNRDVLYETPRDIPVEFPLDRKLLRSIMTPILRHSPDILNESDSKALISAYGIPSVQPYLASTADEAVSIAQRVGFPVAMKIVSPQITHKTDVDGVVLDLANEEAVRAAFARVLASAAAKRPDATVQGVSIQRMVSAPVGYELIVGAKRDRVFGPVILVGAGGIAAELYEDRSLGLPPLNERLARRMLERLRAWPILQGYRGRPAVHLDKLIETLIRVSYLVADYPEILELDINPLLATPDAVIALDSRVVVDRQAVNSPPRPYSHLAIRPYPEEFIRRARLKDGADVLLRPIRPEDEPLWRQMMARCSQESLWFRFRHLLKTTSHEIAARFCLIDYDRELALVAELVSQNGDRHLAGVGRLVADADHTSAEFGLLVSDADQGRGLGSLLTDHCLEICSQWGISRVAAEVSPDNARMLDIFRQRGFSAELRGEAIVVRKELPAQDPVTGAPG